MFVRARYKTSIVARRERSQALDSLVPYRFLRLIFEVLEATGMLRLAQQASAVLAVVLQTAHSVIATETAHFQPGRLAEIVRLCSL